MREMSTPIDPNEIAAGALAAAQDFLNAVQAFAPAGFEALDSAVNQILDWPDDQFSPEVKSEAGAALVIAMQHLPVDDEA